MGDAAFDFTGNGNGNGNGRESSREGSETESLVIDIYPLSSYYFGSKEAIPFKDETLADRVRRMKSNYSARGLRTCVEAVILVELFKHPHMLLLQVRNSIFKLPGGRLRPGESDIDGLKRKLSRKLSVNENGDGMDWQVGDFLGVWWRPDFETLLYPYLSPSVKKPKECTKLYLVKLPESRKFIVPKNLKLLAVPLCQIHENHKTYGSIISGVPQLLSKFSFNIIET
ncbi:Cleavage/polyadenylation specificity factor subunit [Parasponia andersonii]|uniref:Pre-mRNA cleavage factor Im 25 kDa subunit n=1 Tax=Parasponia andersonii TaxID=3476 RepID=A0A2P5ASA6_PARAD|nr:Cleavage/polyadenylation specificity factor subunit [Parasponia andersonii]